MKTLSTYPSLEDHTIKLNFDCNGPNLNGSFVYYPYSLLSASEEGDEDSSEKDDDSSEDLPTATKSSPVLLSFQLSDDSAKEEKGMCRTVVHFSISHTHTHTHLQSCFNPGDRASSKTYNSG